MRNLNSPTIVILGVLLFVAFVAWAFQAPPPWSSEWGNHGNATAINFLEIVLILAAVLVAINANRLSAESASSAADANALAGKALAANIRPWISINLAEREGISWTVDGARFSFVYVLENLGLSPALNVSIDGKFFLPKPGSNFMTEFKEWCEQNTQRARPEMGFGTDIFPNQKSRHPYGYSIGTQEIENFQEAFAAAFKHAGSPKMEFLAPLYFFVCVTYKSIYSEETLRSALMLDLLQVDTESGVPIGIKIGEAVSAERLIIRRTPFGSGSTT